MIPLVAEALLALPARINWIAFEQVFRWPLAALAVILALAGFLFRGQGPVLRPVSIGRGKSGWNWRQFVFPAPVLGLVVLMAAHGGVDSTIIIWFPKFLDGPSFTTHPLAPGIVLSAVSLAYLISRSLLAWLPDKHGRQTLLVLPGLLGGGVFVAGLLSRNVWLSAGGYVLGAFLWSAEFPAMLGIAADQSKRTFSTAMALSQVLSGLVTGALVYGSGCAVSAVGEERMWQIVTTLAVGFMAVGLGGAVWLTWYGRQPAGVESVRAGYKTRAEQPTMAA